MSAIKRDHPESDYSFSERSQHDYQAHAARPDMRALRWAGHSWRPRGYKTLAGPAWGATMRKLARRHFERLQDEVHDLRHAHKTMGVRRRRDAKQRPNHRPAFTLRSRCGMVLVSGERDKKHVGGATQRAPRRLKVHTPALASWPRVAATLAPARKRGTA